MPRIPGLGLNVDERFLLHRLRSTSLGGLAGAAMAGALFFYHYVREDRVDYDLVAVILAIVLVKLVVLAYYRITN